MEYQIVYDRSDVDVEARLNELASQGCRLHSAIPGHFMSDESGWSLAQFVMERVRPEGVK